MMVSYKNKGFGNAIVVDIPRVKQPIPLFVLFRALGIISDKEICEKILLDIEEKKNKEMFEGLQASIIEANKYLTQDECIKYITKFVMYTPINMDKETGIQKKHDFTLEILNNDLFPHCHSKVQKIYFLGYMAYKLLLASFDIILKQDDRDSYLNKRVDLTGVLLNNLYRNYFNKLVKDMEKQIIREINTGSWKSSDDYENIINLTNIYKIVKSTTIENGLKRALSTGDFGIKNTNSNKVGVAQVYNRLNYVSSLSHARRISTPTDKSGKLIPPRKLHNTSWGFLCPAECFDPETQILMWNGTSRRAGDIMVDDILIDDLGNHTTVRTTCSGFKNMYDIIPEKSNFMKHRVTDNHILTLKIRGHKNIRKSNRKDRKYTHIVEYLNREEIKFQEKYFHSLTEAEEFVNSFNDDDTLDITIEEYLKLNKRTKDNLVLFKVEDIHWTKKDVEMDPYLLGMWLADDRGDTSKFNLVEVGVGPYVGWQLHDKRGRFCLKDGLVVHNTPEGQSVGIVKNLSYMTHVTIYSNSLSLYEYIMPHIINIDSTDIKPEFMYGKVKVFINGSWVGITENPEELYLMLKEKKQKGIINIYTGIIFDYKLAEIRVCNDGGRLMRPLLRVKDNNLLITDSLIEKLNTGELVWDDLLTDAKIDNAVIEYIDPEEQSWSLIATKPKDMVPNEKIHHYTHCEIHPSTIFGVLASCIPFPEHNQSPRNTYQCLDINETVLLSSGEKIRIAEVRVGDSVLCFHPETMAQSYTTVVNHYVRKTDKKLYKITTLSDREIIATEDHKFMTTEGWCEVKDMNVFKKSGSTKIGIMPYQTNTVNEPDSAEEIIVTEKQFRELCLKEKFTPLLIDKYVRELKENDLLPLYNTKYSSYKLPVLARIFGVIYSEGTVIYIKNDREEVVEMMINFNNREDVILLKNDVELCGFRKDIYSTSTPNIISVFCRGALPALLMVLGVSIKQSVPRWILNGSKIVKREFLSALKNNYEIIRNNKNGIFMFECNIVLKKYVVLLEEFGITLQKTKTCWSSYNTTISNDYTNLIQYYDMIGYRYSSVKNTQTSIIVEYLKYCSTISKIITYAVQFSYDEWLLQTVVCNNMLFVPIKSIVLVSNDLVSDITVESENHSFIAGNNFLSSNCAQGKQAMGVYVTNYENRMDKTAYVLNYPMRPLVDTRIMNMIELNKIPSGTQAIVAIMTHSGYNQEDSLLINQGSIDRGMALVTVYHTEKDEDKQKINGDEEIRCKPDAAKTKGMKMGNYNKVNSKGVMPENTLVQNRDVIIAKITPIKENRNDHTKVIKFEDQSKIYKTNEDTYIDKNYIDRNGEGYNFAKVRLRTVRKPVIGDKFSSRMGQKGTVGNIIPECDMPFTSSGVRPDIIINPHAIPSRMTIGQLKETLLGKVLVELGLFGDGTPFGEFDIKDICSELLKVGYESNGNELLYNGLTGEQHECSVFMGPVFYQRLKHMVNDKAHSRSIGPMVNLTRQPAEGRSRDGGLRFGEMEKDAMVSHGAARFTRGRMYDVSDKYSVHVCKLCGLIASYNDKMHIHHCRTCDNRTNFAYVEIPYACKLLFQELNTMNVAPRIMTTNV
jgi:DNA-directed RNA polymerase beta subunit